MSAARGGQFSAKEDHAIAAEVLAYATAVAIAKTESYGRDGDGAGGGAAAGSEALTGAVVDVLGANTVLIEVECTVAANATGTATASFASSVDGTNFTDRENDFTTVACVLVKDITLPLVGSLLVCRKHAIVDVRGLHKIKLSNIINSDAAIAITANCTISKVN